MFQYVTHYTYYFFYLKDHRHEILPTTGTLINLSNNDIATTTMNTLNSDSCPLFIKHTSLLIEYGTL